MDETLPPAKGRLNPLLIVAIFFGLGTLLFGTLAVIAYSERTKAVTTLNEQVSSAVAKAKDEQKKTDEIANGQANQLPYKLYTAGKEDGAFQLQMPKNWSLYAERPGSGTTQLFILAGLNFVTFDKGGVNTQMFKVELVRNTALDEVKKFQTKVKKNQVKTTTVKVSGIDATRVEGEIDEDRHNGVKIIVPVRDKALIFTTESQSFVRDFNQIVTTAKIVP